ncbi:integral membrane protein [Enterococcus sp. 10A9_DIV0425]|uniref:Integral membrane protein n=1 Tax=Candidatus Enterococcus wittei TaxID=1987383 RepID=A0A2C9XP14_9ENTE|nr:ECF transporter S component [Enterococcus sp. 10A9_DIV0425]OTP11933.1 integral membrane protein [Enterococcus sp. 10A9_DIV0425]THE15994.1 ECF transporter S component [Enterococcus hirae]
MNSKNKTFRLVLRAILLAIIIVQAMVPWLGFIPLGFISLTIIHITVITAAVVLGPKDGMLIGLFWGIATIVRAYAMPTTPFDTLVFTNPVISVVPRILVGLVAGFVFHWLYQRYASVTRAAIFAGVLGSLVNTILVLGFMGLFYTNATAQAYGVDTSVLFKTLAGIAAINGIPEAIGAGIITPLLAKALFAATPLKPE